MLVGNAPRRRSSADVKEIAQPRSQANGDSACSEFEQPRERVKAEADTEEGGEVVEA